MSDSARAQDKSGSVGADGASRSSDTERTETAAREPRDAERTERAASDGVSRRSMLQAGALAAASLAGSGARAQSTAPAIATGSVAGRPFRAFVRHGTTSSIEDLRLRDIKPRQVLVRTTASCGCYTITRSVLGAAPVQSPMIPNHSGFGVVEAVGGEVRRVRVGDRVLVCGTPECGQCYQCLHGNPEACNYLNSQLFNEPIAD